MEKTVKFIAMFVFFITAETKATVEAAEATEAADLAKRKTLEEKFAKTNANDDDDDDDDDDENEFYSKQEDSNPLSISTNISQEGYKEFLSKNKTIIGIAMAAVGAGLAYYGYMCDKNTVTWYENDYQNQTGQQARDTWESIKDAQKIRNISYGAGGVFLVSGLGVMIFF